MSTMDKEYINYIEVLGSVFTAEHGKVKILLTHKKTEPYKGYWVLPGAVMKQNETTEECFQRALKDKTGMYDIYHEQCGVFSALTRTMEDRLVAINYLGLMDSKSAELKRIETDEEWNWFGIDALPKLGYDHLEVIQTSIEALKGKIIHSNILKILFPSDFTLPEIQKVYEKILNETLDRRNFRKKFMNLGMIEYTGYRTEGLNGRPAKLYHFLDSTLEAAIF